MPRVTSKIMCVNMINATISSLFMCQFQRMQSFNFSILKANWMCPYKSILFKCSATSFMATVTVVNLHWKSHNLFRIIDSYQDKCSHPHHSGDSLRDRNIDMNRNYSDISADNRHCERCIHQYLQKKRILLLTLRMRALVLYWAK